MTQLINLGKISAYSTCFYRWVTPQEDSTGSGYFQYYDNDNNYIALCRINISAIKTKSLKEDSSILNVYSIVLTTEQITVEESGIIPEKTLFGWCP